MFGLNVNVQSLLELRFTGLRFKITLNWILQVFTKFKVCEINFFHNDGSYSG